MREIALLKVRAAQQQQRPWPFLLHRCSPQGGMSRIARCAVPEVMGSLCIAVAGDRL
jgi:hypothetical protein